MEESCAEGPASHGDPESCSGARKDPAEALTGAHTGGVSSREINDTEGADDVCVSGRQHSLARKGECPGDPTRSETSSTCGNSMRENRESPGPTRNDGKDEGGKRTGSPWPRVPRDEKSGEDDTRQRVGPSPSRSALGRSLTPIQR